VPTWRPFGSKMKNVKVAGRSSGAGLDGKPRFGRLQTIRPSGTGGWKQVHPRLVRSAGLRLAGARAQDLLVAKAPPRSPQRFHPTGQTDRPDCSRHCSLPWPPSGLGSRPRRRFVLARFAFPCPSSIRADISDLTPVDRSPPTPTIERQDSFPSCCSARPRCGSCTHAEGPRRRLAIR
jgi:hypothetical protein